MIKTEKVELTSQQKELIALEWGKRPKNPPSIPELIKLCWPEAKDSEIDARSYKGKAIRTFLSQEENVIVKKVGYEPAQPIVLTEEQKEYIRNNCATMKANEMAEVIFNKTNLYYTARECRAVIEYLRSINQREKLYEDLDNIPDENYTPPKSLSRVIARINRYTEGLQKLDESNLKDRQKKDCYNLIGFLHNHRFLYQINKYDKQADRELIESTFINYVWDKPDLTPEEVDQYVVLATEKVIAASILEQIEKLRKRLDNITEDEDAKVSMSLVELISSCRTEYNQCILRQEKLLAALKGTRANRLGNKIKENATILNLVNEWKNEESRKEMIMLAERQKEPLKKEYERLTSMDAIKAKVFGISQDEVLNS